jgi:hypothetical protein
MPFTDARPVESKTPNGTGISMSLSEPKRGRQVVRLTFSSAVQVALFGGPIRDLRFDIGIGRGADEGKLRLVLVDDGEFVAGGGVAGSASIRITAWDLLPKSKMPSAAISIDHRPSNVEVILKLPSWAKPNGAGGRMEQEFGIKRAKEKA